MAKLPESFTKAGTLSQIEDQEFTSYPRPYLGVSQIGHSCLRYLWYSFRWAFTETHSYRQIRLFGRGHREEPVLIKALESVGIECYGDQTECVAVFGFVKGHCDGMAINVPEAPKTPHLLEFKTMNDKNFKEMKKSGCKHSKPVYWAQMQLYMYYLKLKRALFVAVNKNDDSLYIERVYYNPADAEMYEKRATEVVLAQSPPERQFKKSWYACKWCPAFGICHENELPKYNCRTCQHVLMQPEGKWFCNKGKDHHPPVILPVRYQELGCEDHLCIEM